MRQFVRGLPAMLLRNGGWGLVLLLLVLRMDVWQWDDTSLVLGFVPIGLAYHLGISLAAGFTWYLVVKFAWPDHVEAWAEEGDEGA